MKSRFTLIVVALVTLNLVACGKNEETKETAKISAAAIHVAYTATLAEGIQFAAKPYYPTFIKSVSGMTEYEAAGRWTEGKKTVFTFAQSLPATFTLTLDLVSAFGPNAGKVIQIQVGDWKGQFIADAKPSTNKFIVKTSAPADSIEFIIPEPTSPKDLGATSGDPRQLGIMFKRLSIIQ